jgi:predicted ATPase/DNA-binding SARP family transcriptional activator
MTASANSGAARSPVRIALFGTPALFVGGQAHRFQNKKTLALLAYLLIEQRAHPRATLATLLWPESNEPTARSALRNILVEVRAVAPWALEADRDSVRFDAAAVPNDVVLLERVLKTHDLAALQSVEEFPSGELLAGLTMDDAAEFEDWLSQQREIHRRAFARALGSLVEVRRQAGKLEDALRIAQRRLSVEPLSDVAERALLEVLFDAGERDAAMRAFDDYTALLRRELGTVPAAELRDLVVRRLDASGVRLPVARRRRGTGDESAPSQPLCESPAFIGRENDLRALLRILGEDDVRALTLSGPGGVGKTTLALEICGRARTMFDQVAFIELASVNNPELVLPALAKELGVVEDKGTPTALRIGVHLAGRSCLLVLDNFEQLLAAVPAIADLLTAAPGVTVLVTSRAVLRLRGEHVYSLAPLEVPAPDAGFAPGGFPTSNELAAREKELALVPAMRLFCARARSQGQELQGTELEAAAEICRRLDGLPLALELAAARLRSLSVSTLLDRLERRLTVLTAGPRDAPSRQQTLRDTLTWSYELLEPSDKAALRALSVFAGGVDAKMAELVAGASLDVVSSLVDQSLLTRVATADDRYVLLETVREFAAEKLLEAGERLALRRRHLGALLGFAEAVSLELHGAEQRRQLAKLEREHGNLRAALEHASVDPEVTELGLRLSASLIWFWHLRGHWSEGRRWLQRFLESETGEPLVRGRALYGLGLLECAQEDFELAERRLADALPLLSAVDQPRDRAHALGLLAVAGIYQRRTDGLLPYLEESLALFERSGDAWGIALSHLRLGILSWLSLDAESALVFCSRSHDAFEQLGNDWGVAMSLANLGESHLALGNVDAAVLAYVASLAPLERIGSNWYLALNVSGLAGALARSGRAALAANLLAAVRTNLQTRNSALPPLDRFIFENSLQAARERLAEDEFDRESANGADLPLREAIANVRSILQP